MSDSNISILFNSLGSSSSSSNIFDSVDLSQYASIKNGSYSKLTKAYYAKADSSSDDSSDSDTTDSTSSVSSSTITDTTGLSKMKTEADNLKSSADKLGSDDLYKETNGSVDMDKIASAVKSFVNDYNDVIKQSDNVSSSEVSSDVSSISSMTSVMSKALSNIGITVGTDGKLSLDEDTLKEAGADKVQALFDGSSSYGAQISSLASSVSSDALMNSSTYSSDGQLVSSLLGSYSSWV